jgi:hypothetical protein
MKEYTFFPLEPDGYAIVPVELYEELQEFSLENEPYREDVEEQFPGLRFVEYPDDINFFLNEKYFLGLDDDEEE